MVSVLHYVKETMAHFSKHESVQLILYFGGIVDGQIPGYFISSKNNKLTTLVPTKSQVGLLCNMSSEVDKELHDKFMYEVQCTPTAEKMIEVQKKYNDIIATYDNSVNTTHYVHVIKL
ncbi:hypothetical protein MKX42_12305 [Paenibacillus sp. FSL R7-0204]|uniref:hypothetical protein n=1 Tax=Paenibacillus sp. FSL R7-0204 TaxID=2921675 RepID=UPI0030F6FFEA